MEDFAGEMVTDRGVKIRFFTTYCSKDNIQPFYREAIKFWLSVPEEEREKIMER